MFYCPICEHKLKVETYYDYAGICEEYKTCENCGRYRTEFVYGDFTEIIGDVNISSMKNDLIQKEKNLYLLNNKRKGE